MFMEFQAGWKSVHYIKNYTQLLVHGRKVNINSDNRLEELERGKGLKVML